MAARKKEADFNEYFEFLWGYASFQGISKGQFMKDSGLSPQRFSEFSHKTRNITAEYFLKMCSGLELTPEDVEHESDLPFSEEQRVLIQFDSFVKSQRLFLEELMGDPAKLQLCKIIVSCKYLIGNPHLRRLFFLLSNIFTKVNSR